MSARAATVTLEQSQCVDQTPLASPAPVHKQTDPTAGTLLLAAFRKLGIGVDERTAFARTKDWYRASGAVWTRTLD